MNVADLIVDHEGEVLTLYQDTVGKLSIGVGRNLTDKGISQEESRFLLANDIAEAKHGAETFPWFSGLDEVRQAAVIDLVFNLGLTKLRKFVDFRDAMGRHDWHRAAEELKDSRWYEQVTRRGPRIVGMIRSGEWPK